MIDAGEAVIIAYGRAKVKGWPWNEPVSCELRRGWFGGNGRYEVWTNAGMLGTKARFVTNAETGAVLEQGYIPR